MPYTLTYMWNIKKQKQNQYKIKKPKLIVTENRLVIPRSGGWRVGKWVKKVKRYKLPVVK